MGVDGTLKRYYVALVCALIALAAFFQASGMTELVGAAVVGAPAPSSTSPSTVGKASLVPPPNEDHARSAKDILARNPFDSITGPLDGKSLDLPSSAAPPTAEDGKDPFQDPDCNDVRVLLVLNSDDPEWSFASLAGSDGQAVLRRAGQELGNQKVHFVGWDRVWLSSGAGRCQARVFVKDPPKKGPAPRGQDDAAPKRPGSKLQQDIMSKIQKISDTEYAVERSVVPQIIENQAELARTAKLQQVKEGNKVIGLKLGGLRSSSVLSQLGFKNGDTLTNVNGVEMSDPEKMMQVYSKLPQMNHMVVTMLRDNKPTNIDISIK